MKTATVQINIKIQANLKKAVDRAAAAAKKTSSEWIRDTLAEATGCNAREIRRGAPPKNGIT